MDEIDVSRQILRQQTTILCRDCKSTVYFAQGQVSASCDTCGNIEFLSAGENTKTKTESHWIRKIAERAVNRAFFPTTEDRTEKSLANFRRPINQLLVQKLIVRHQTEWQLWAALVKDFSHAELHSAYLTAAMQSKALPMASQRYSEHRRIMSTLAEERWQAGIADLMLERIVNLSILLGESHLGKAKSRRPLPAFLDSPIWKATWFMVGLLFFGALTIHYFHQ